VSINGLVEVFLGLRAELGGFESQPIALRDFQEDERTDNEASREPETLQFKCNVYGSAESVSSAGARTEIEVAKWKTWKKLYTFLCTPRSCISERF